MSGYRFQLSRRKGYRMPPGGRSCAAPSRYANPWRPAVSGLLPAEAVTRFRVNLNAGRLPFTREDVARDLAGVPLGCYCSLEAPCHVDVLLEIANPEDAR